MDFFDILLAGKLNRSGGGNAFTKTTYTVTVDNLNISSAITNAHIPLISQDEVLIFNIKGENIQTTGTVTGKCGMIVVQDGAVIGNAGWRKTVSGKVAPDSCVAGTNISNGFPCAITDGYYTGTSLVFFIAAGNTVDFIQIPYNMGWATS